MKNDQVKIFPTHDDLFISIAHDFKTRAHKAVETKGEFTVVLSGGDTPKIFFDTLTQIKSFKEEIPWDKIKFFFGDERFVPADSAQSNYHMAYEHLFSKIPVVQENIYRIITEFIDPKDAAKNYEITLRNFFSIKDNEFPVFDLLYLGLGDDAHTASLMPLSEVLAIQNHRIVDSLWVSAQNMYRITLTAQAINHALAIAFLVTGQNKAHAVAQVLEGTFEPLQYPAQLIQGNHQMWYLDQEAASQLKKR